MRALKRHYNAYYNGESKELALPTLSYFFEEENEAWKEQARCRIEQKPTDFFFPGSSIPGNAKKWKAEVREFCGGCPVKKECLQYADMYYIREGVFGGLTFNDRRDRNRVRLHGGDYGLP